MRTGDFEVGIFAIPLARLADTFASVRCRIQSTHTALHHQRRDNSCDITQLIQLDIPRPAGCRPSNPSYVHSCEHDIRRCHNHPRPSIALSESGTILTDWIITGCHRWQGPLAWSSCQHCRQAALERPEDCRRPLRGPQHLWRILSREAYVPLSVQSESKSMEEDVEIRDESARHYTRARC